MFQFKAYNPIIRFWTYLIAALQTVQPRLGQTALAALQSPGFANLATALPIEKLLTSLINDEAFVPTRPLLCLGHAWALTLTGQFVALERRLQDTERGLPKAPPALHAARTNGQSLQAPYAILVAMAIEGDIYLAQGKLGQAARTYEEGVAFGLAHNGGQPFPPAGTEPLPGSPGFVVYPQTPP